MLAGILHHQNFADCLDGLFGADTVGKAFK